MAQRIGQQSKARTWSTRYSRSALRFIELLDGGNGRHRHWQATPSPNRQSPNACTLALRRRMRCGPTVNLDCLKTFFERSWAPPAGLPSPVRGHTSADDEWLREKELVH